MAENKKSLITKAVEAWVAFKAGKGLVKMTAPLAIAGVGYYLLKKYRAGAVA